ncbi:MAG: hypothetical protein ABIU05_05945 [Nitrospirales bacterium]
MQERNCCDAGYRMLEAETQVEAVGLAEGERSGLMLGYGNNNEQFRLLANNASLACWCKPGARTRWR